MRLVALIASTAALVASLLAVFFTSDVVALPHNTESPGPRIAKRVLVVVIDGLRYDTALETDLMPEVRRLASAGSFGLAMATEVTMTEVGVRTLGTGATPCLVDYLWPKQRQELDNPLAAFAAIGGRIAIVGSGTWWSQFGRAAHVKVDGLDRPCARNFLGNCPDSVYVDQALSVLRRDDWDLLVAHLPGIDSASHRYTAFTEPFREKARETDALIARMVEAAGPEATVIVTSDHGSGDRGHHGSGEPAARRTPIVLAGPGIRPGVRLSVRQNDFAPTLAVLLGVPIPASSEGTAIASVLDVTSAARDAIVAANHAQLSRYVDAFVRARGIARPSLDPNDPDAVGRFLVEIRSRASMVPMVWATVLAILAVLLVVRADAASPSSAVAAWCALALVAAVGAGLEPRSPMIAAIAVGIALVGFWREPREATGRDLLPLAVVAAVVELVIAFWRVNHREIQLAVVRLGNRMRAEEDAVFALFVAAGVALATIALRHRAGMRPTHRWTILALLFVASAGGDTLALPVGIGAGVLVALVAVDRERLPNAIVLVALFIGALALERYRLPESALLGALGPLACGAAAIAVARHRSRTALLTIGALAVAACLVRAAGTPSGPYAALVIGGAACALVVPVLLPAAQRTELLGFLALVLISVFCQPIQVPGLLAVALAASMAAPLVANADPERVLLRGVFLALAVRLALFAVFERDFSFSRLEIWLAFMGNASGERFALVIILLKFVLSFTVAVALVDAYVDARDRLRIVAACGAFLLLRVAHIVLSMTVARGTYYSPNADAGPLLFTLCMAVSLLAAAAVLWFQRARA